MKIAQYRLARAFLPFSCCQAKFWADVFRRFRQRRLSVRLNACYHAGVQSYLARYLPVLRKAECTSPDNACTTEYDGSVWMCWFQGYENMPSIVKKCVDSVKLHSRGRRTVILTEKNARDFAEFPQFVLDKYKAGLITKTHFSDMLRMAVLYRYGGLWVDATVLVTGDLPDSLFERDFYSIKREFASPFCITNNQNKRVSVSCSGFRWAGYFMASHKGGFVPCAVLAVLFAYWKDNTQQIDYFLIDEVINFCYENSDTFRAMIDSVPMNNPDAGFFGYAAETDEKELLKQAEEALKKTYVFKLSYKKNYDESVQHVIDRLASL